MGDPIAPALGLGVYRVAPEDAERVVSSALELGYRLVDTAARYGNEREVGSAVRRSGLREEVAVQTKIWISDYADAARGVDKALRKLDLGWVDSVLLHVPLPSRFDLTVEAYRALEGLLERGVVRSIGVSNFSAAQLRELASHSSVPPALNQVELHPYFAQPELQAEHRASGVLAQAWSPLGGVIGYTGAGGGPGPLEDPAVAAVAERRGCTPAQAVLAWHLRQGRSAVAKSTRPERLAENLAALEVELAEEDLAAIDALDRGERCGLRPDDVNLEEHGVPVPDA